MIKVDKILYINETNYIIYQRSSSKVLYQNTEIDSTIFAKFLKNQDLYIVFNEQKNEVYTQTSKINNLSYIEKIQWKKSLEKEENGKYIRVFDKNPQYILTYAIKENQQFNSVKKLIKESQSKILGIFSSAQILQTAIYNLMKSKSIIKNDEFYLIIFEIFQNYYQHIICKDGFIYLQRFFEKSEEKNVFRDFIIESDAQETINLSNQEIFINSQEQIEKIKIISLTSVKYSDMEITPKDLCDFYQLKSENIYHLNSSLIQLNKSQVVNFYKGKSSVLHVLSKYKTYILLSVFFILSLFDVYEMNKISNNIKENEMNLRNIKQENKKLEKELKISQQRIKSLYITMKDFDTNIDKFCNLISFLLINLPRDMIINSIEISDKLSEIEIRTFFENFQDFVHIVLRSNPKVKVINNEYVITGKINDELYSN